VKFVLPFTGSDDMTEEDFDNWIAAYIDRQEREEIPVDGGGDLFWAVDKFFCYNDEEPELCWQAILEILRRKPSNKVFAILAAGPLEDLIQYHGTDYIDRIEIEARTNPDFKHLLGGVWESSSPAVWKRVVFARGEPR
jgi:hypothetical protein